ncbi:MAG: beta-ketoacyl-ACP synthase II [Alphaproteobacteria bacterium]|nr:beta-ketoacyl-ACP synthase II [Alphaproteobacteria bacterium]
MTHGNVPDSRRVVVTGLGTINPCGHDVPTTWDAMVHARSGTGLLTRFDASDLPSQAAAEVKGFDPEVRLGRKLARRMGLFAQYAVVASHEALDDAGFDADALAAANDQGVTPDADPWLERFGVYVGTGIGGFPEIADEAERRLQDGTRRISALFIPRALNNLATGQIAIRYGARGPSLCIATACAVGNHSIGEAFRAIQRGDADVLLAGGTEAALTPLGYGGFMTMRALTRNVESPGSASRPFDGDRDGFVMGEGAGILVLESLAHARARGARIYCELVGYAATTDAHHITAPAPGHGGAARCMKLALASAGVAPEDVGYINAHGTSTPLNDAEETVAIKTVFGDHARRVVISSTKGVSGHLLGAAGGLEAVAVCKALETGVLPPTAHLDHPDPACDLDYCPREARETRPRVALSNGFGFGGTNACLVFRTF